LGSSLSQTVYVAVGVLIFLFGLVILREAPRQRLNIVTAFMLFLAGLGSVLAASGRVLHGAQLEGVVSYSPLLENFAYLWEFFFPALLLFSLLFPKERPILRRVPYLGAALFAPYVFHLLLLVWGSMAGADLGLPELAKRFPALGPLVSAVGALARLAYMGHRVLFSLVNLSYAFASCAVMAGSYRRYDMPQLRSQMRVIFLGMGLCVVLYSLAVPIPALLSLAPSGDYMVGTVVAALVLGSGSIAYAVVRYRFLDVRMMARRGILYAAVSGIMVAVYLLIVRNISQVAASLFGLDPGVLDAVFLVIAVILFQPAIGAMEGILDAILVGDKRDYRNVLRSLSRDVITILDRDELADKIVEGLRGGMVIESGALLLRGSSGAPSTVLTRGGDVHRRRGDDLRLGGGPARNAGPGNASGGFHLYRSFGLEGLEHGVAILPWSPELAELPAAELMTTVEFLGALDPSSREAARVGLERLKARSVAVLRHGSEVLGALVLGEKITRTRYTAEDAALLSTLASQISSALKNAALYEESVERSRLEEEMMLARKIQRSFLPSRFPSLPGLDIHASAVPSKYVGGDYFDVLNLGDGRVVLAVADVAGKGVPAGLLMSMLQASLRTQVSENGVTVSRILTRMNKLVYESTSSEQFATCFLCAAHVPSCTLTFSNAGHNYPVLMRADGSYDLLEAGGLILGVLGDVTFDEGRTSMSPGDTLVCYTDGVTEARNPSGEEYGEGRLLELLRSLDVGSSAAEVVAAVQRSVFEFTAGTEQADDMTLLVLKAR